MDAVKNHVFTTIALTVCSAVLWGSDLPYFPIEISRTAVSGAVPNLVFKGGIASLIVTLILSGTLAYSTAAIWIGLMIVAFVGDVHHLMLHLSGVGIVFIATLYRAYLVGVAESLPPFIVAVLIFVLRWVTKGAVILFLEVGMPNSWTEFLRPAIYLTVMDKAMQVMYHGAKACQYHPRAVMAVFEVNAVLQWVAFYSLSKCF